MLLVQKYLERHSFAELAKEHGAYASFSKSGHKWSLNYDQIEARENDELAQECRGHILSCWDGQSLREQADEKITTDKDGQVVIKEGIMQGHLSYDHIVPGKTRVLAYPMKRFFNYGQGAAAEIDWSDPNLSILEKLDGTLCIVYYDPFTNQWCVATRSVPEADLLMDNGLYTFRTLFEKALRETIASSSYAGLSFEEYAAILNKEITYCYELTTPLNRIVVSYSDYRITLIAARINAYCDLPYETAHVSKELEIEELPSYGVPIVSAHKQMSVNKLIEWVSSLNPMENEGVVVRVRAGQDKFNRIKIKNPSYVLYSKARDSLGHSERNCLEIILLGKEDDLIPYLPEEIVQNLLKIKSSIQDFIKKYDEAYKIAYHETNAIAPNDKKTFALYIKNMNIWTAPLFQIFDRKCSNMHDFIEKNKREGSFSDSFLDKLLEIIK